MQLFYINMTFLQGKSLIELSKEYIAIIDFEDIAIVYFFACKAPISGFL